MGSARWSAQIRLDFTVPVEPHAIRTIRLTIESFAADRGFSPKKVSDLGLAVSEALFNAVEHGNQGTHTIDIELEYFDDRVQIAVADDGLHGEEDTRYEELKKALDGPLEPHDTPDIDLERGRGLFLIRAKSDEVRVERAKEGGVRVVMVKRR